MRVKLYSFISMLFLMLGVVLCNTSAVKAQEGESTVIDEVIAQVNDDVITLSMLKRENRERIEALKSERKMTDQQASEEVLKRYIGTYEIADMHLTIDMTINNGLLIAQPYRDSHPGPTSTMLALDDKHFYDKIDEELEITFDADPSGKVKGVTILQMGTTKYAKKIK